MTTDSQPTPSSAGAVPASGGRARTLPAPGTDRPAPNVKDVVDRILRRIRRLGGRRR
jgi:hypothetical protein